MNNVTQINMNDNEMPRILEIKYLPEQIDLSVFLSEQKTEDENYNLQRQSLSAEEIFKIFFQSFTLFKR